MTRALSDLKSVTGSCLPQHTESLLQTGGKSPLPQPPSSTQDRVLIQEPKEALGDRLRANVWNTLDLGHAILKQNQPGCLLPCISLSSLLFPAPPSTHPERPDPLEIQKLPLEILSVDNPCNWRAASGDKASKIIIIQEASKANARFWTIL